MCDIAALPSAQADVWDGLLASQPLRSPFLSHAFCRAVDDARGGIRVLRIGGESGACGFLPFQLRRGRGLLGHAEKVGGALSDMFGVVGSVRTALDPQFLLRSARLSSLRFDHAVEELCPFAFGDREKTGGVRVEVEDFSRFRDDLARRDPDFVGRVGAGERRLAKKFGAIRFEWHAGDASAELDRIIAVKREQYRQTGVADSLAEDWQRGLLRRLLRARETSPLCRPVLSTIFAGENWVASHLALTCADTFHIWFPAYDPRFGRYGPGHMLLFKMLEHGVREGFRRFDFGQGEATYKSRYQGEFYPLWKGAIRRHSLLGYSERALQTLKWRIRNAAARRRAARAADEGSIRNAGAAHDV
jgi:CelD/BcsL family acetyltransferase involved in cellulose biosynthesis